MRREDKEPDQGDNTDDNDDDDDDDNDKAGLLIVSRMDDSVASEELTDKEVKGREEGWIHAEDTEQELRKKSVSANENKRARKSQNGRMVQDCNATGVC